MMKFERKLNRILEIFLVILMSVLVIDVLWQVFSRYLLASPSSFTDELAGYLLIWVGMLGAAYVAGRQEHLAIDIVLQRSRPSVKKRLSLIIHLMILLFAVAVMAVGGIILMYTRFALEVKSAALQLPLGYVYIVMPISGLIIVYYKILHIQELRKTD
jgi:TRAP-type C4-dicarboxylate transport system permease small subunit